LLVDSVTATATTVVGTIIGAAATGNARSAVIVTRSAAADVGVRDAYATLLSSIAGALGEQAAE
jgi:hypothetical protein